MIGVNVTFELILILTLLNELPIEEPQKPIASLFVYISSYIDSEWPNLTFIGKNSLTFTTRLNMWITLTCGLICAGCDCGCGWGCRCVAKGICLKHQSHLSVCWIALNSPQLQKLTISSLLSWIMKAFCQFQVHPFHTTDTRVTDGFLFN